MEEISIFYIIIGNGFYGFIALFANSKDVLSWLVIFEKLIENVINIKRFWKIWEPCEYIGYFKGFCETTWNWTVFWIHVTCELFMFYPCDVMCDYFLARYYSLCDIGILAPVFVTVYEFRPCDGDEFRLCDSRLVSSLWRHMSSVFMMALSSIFVTVD